MFKKNLNNFGKRFCAYILDVMFLSILFAVIGLLNKMLGLLSPYTLAGVGYLLTVVYFAYMESGAYQATFGKRILGLIVVHSDTGEAITFKRALIRNIVRIVNMPIYCLGYITILFTKKHQALHDLIVRTTVVPADEEEYDYEEDE